MSRFWSNYKEFLKQCQKCDGTCTSKKEGSNETTTTMNASGQCEGGIGSIQRKCFHNSCRINIISSPREMNFVLICSWCNSAKYILKVSNSNHSIELIFGEVSGRIGQKMLDDFLYPTKCFIVVEMFHGKIVILTKNIVTTFSQVKASTSRKRMCNALA